MARTFVLAVTVAFAVLGSPRPTAAQDPGCAVLCSPILIAQPGVSVTNVVSPPVNPVTGESVNAGAEFQMRLATAIPTSIPRTTLGVLVQWLPFASDADGFGMNAVSFGYAAVINAISTTATNGVFSLDVVPIGAFSPAALPGDESAYTHKAIVEGNAYLHLGGLLPESAPALLQQTSVHALTAYVASGIPDAADPVAFQFGLTIPIAPFPR